MVLQVEYRLKLGQDEFVIKAEVENEKEFFETMSFFSSLPKTAPNGANDLKLSFRKTKKGHKYYSLVSESEKVEFKFGQNLESNGNGLFPKGWTKLFEGDDDSYDQDEQPTQVASPFPIPTIQPSIQEAPTQSPIVKTPTASAVPKVSVPAFTPPVVKPSTPTAQATTEKTTAPVNPEVSKMANNVLARFGVKNT